mmetsp:Transcript_1439/g.2283  ORF Transcript_1439/g.2283 Transcript_1439/m.2283 type:complete len:384 (-) Transcript_1439:555-1706(-)|eukprot:CAMPEP_0197021738 /NCGR_PEP_ID=MMETSP1384-20130603/2673_1 /TAXON_ID=29189 /ORGANISM="Ammonia sp." /LENGTH=383 /DNA_ID=CAMNT_0042449641 /DNA_START=33 /DNA_END=1184 /DNA_ORIENTATION=+
MSLFNKTKHKTADTSKPGVIIDNTKLKNEDRDKGPPLPVENWIDGDLFLCTNPSVESYHHTNYDKQVAIPFNTVFQLESKIFKGCAIARAIDMPSTDKAYFRGRNRKMDFTFQGEFKRRVCFDRLYTGQIFDRPFTKLPAQYLISAAIKVLKSLAPALRGDINSDTPHMISPLASAAQVFEVSKPGQQTPLPQEPKEDLSLIDARFKNMKWTDRKNYFHNVEHLKQFYFEPGLVYTISCYSHMISPTSYSMHMLGMKVNISQYMSAPMQIASVILPEEADDNDSNSNSNSADSNDVGLAASGNNQIGDDTQQMETIQSEELQCESKEEEDEQQAESDGLGDLNKCEFVFNLQVWHTKLVDELYTKDQKKHKKSSSGFRSLFSK